MDGLSRSDHPRARSATQAVIISYRFARHLDRPLLRSWLMLLIPPRRSIPGRSIPARRKRLLFVALGLSLALGGTTEAQAGRRSGPASGVSGFKPGKSGQPTRGDGGTAGAGQVGSSVSFGRNGNGNGNKLKQRSKEELRQDKLDRDAKQIVKDYQAKSIKRASERSNREYAMNQIRWAAEAQEREKTIPTLMDHRQLGKMVDAHSAASAAARKGTATKFQKKLVRKWHQYESAVAAIKANEATVAQEKLFIKLHATLKTIAYKSATPLPEGWGFAGGTLHVAEQPGGVIASDGLSSSTHPWTFANYARELAASEKFRARFFLPSEQTTFEKNLTTSTYTFESALDRLRDGRASGTDLRTIKSWVLRAQANRAQRDQARALKRIAE